MVLRRGINNVLNLSLPAVGEMILYTITLILDSMMLGKYGGHTMVSAAGLCNEIFYAIINVFITLGIGVSVTSMVARKMGANKIKEAEEYATLSIFVTLIITLIIVYMVLNFKEEILVFAGAKDMVLELGIIYVDIAVFGYAFRMITTTINSIIRGYGDTETPFFIAGVISIFNIILDYFLIFSDWGIKGSAIALTISQIVGFVIVFSYIIFRSPIKPKIKGVFKIKIRILKELVLLSIPSSLEEASFSISRLLTLFMIMRAGTTAFAANQIATNIESMSFMVGTGFGTAATTLVGLKVGEKKYKTAEKYAICCAGVGVGIMVLFAVVFLIFPDQLIFLFTKKNEQEVIFYSVLCLMIAAVEQPFIGISLIISGALKGIGDTKSPFIVSAITSWLVRLPLMYYFIYIKNNPVTFVWWITAFQWFIDAAMMFIVFRTKFRK